jgi:hypothetical protein
MTGEPPPAPAPEHPDILAPSIAIEEAKPCLGVLFVHGAGDHGVGATLIEFGEPLVSWLNGWLAKGELAKTSADDDVRAGAGQILVREADTGAPAHARLTLRSGDAGKRHLWLLAEARWDEAFTPPEFRQVLLWAIGVVPWTVLTQFIAPVIDESRHLQAGLLPILRFYWNLVFSTLIALVASVVLQAFALAILLLSIIPLDPVRDIVSKLQRFASSSVGDLYMVLTSPIQRAALTSAVQRDIEWMRRKGCERIAVVAHSQGGYVAYQALTDPWYQPVETFITFGSGLIRLTESERARRTGVLLWALIGVIGGLIAFRFAPIAIPGTFTASPTNQAVTFTFVVGLVMFTGLIAALVAYRRSPTHVAPLPFAATWFDFVTHEDPVMNGVPDEKLPATVETHWVENRASVVADHGSYWHNSDEFVPQVALAIGTLDEELDLKHAGPTNFLAAVPGKKDQVVAVDVDQFLHRSYERRSQRITALQNVRASLAAATAILLLWRLDQLEAVGRLVADAFTWFPSFVVSWLPDVIQQVIPIAFSHLALLGAAVILALSLVGYQVAIGLWEKWGTADTMRQWQGMKPEARSRQAKAFYSWTTLQIVLLVIVGFFGPVLIIRFLGDVWAAKDPIVQAWARQATWSLIAAGAFLGAVWYRSKKLPERPLREVVLNGTLLAVAVELVVAMLNPGPLAANVSIPLGLAAEVLGLIVAQAIAPSVAKLFVQFADIAESKVIPMVEEGQRASPLDRLGVLGAIAVAASVVMAFQPAPIAMIFGAALAGAGLFFAWLMATNTSGRTRKYLGTNTPTPELLRIEGWGVALAGAALLAVELARLGIYLATYGIPR